MRRLQQILFAVALLLAAATTVHAQTAEIFEPYKQTELRLPSVPLLLNDPYFSLWSPHDKLNDGTTRHWADIEKPMDGLLRVDGVSYRFMGSGRGYLLSSIAPMANEQAWEGRVSYSGQNGTAWTTSSFDDSSWETQQAAWGTPNEYPNVRNPWTATNSDIYIRRTVNLTDNVRILVYRHLVPFLHDALHILGKPQQSLRVLRRFPEILGGDRIIVIIGNFQPALLKEKPVDLAPHIPRLYQCAVQVENGGFELRYIHVRTLSSPSCPLR
jgi:hypothetical protein